MERKNQYGGRMKISEREWNQYLEDCHSNYMFCKPKKEDIENFLTWKEGAKNDTRVKKTKKT